MPGILKWPLRGLLMVLSGPLLHLIWVVLAGAAFVLVEDQSVFYAALLLFFPIALFRWGCRVTLDAWGLEAPKQPRARKAPRKNKNRKAQQATSVSVAEMAAVPAVVAAKPRRGNNRSAKAMQRQLAPELRTFLLGSMRRYF